MQLVIKENRLEKENTMPVLKLESSYYKISLFYAGDYTEDVRDKTASYTKLMISCKPKRSNLPELHCDHSWNVMLDTSNITPAISVTCKEAESMKENLDIAMETARELQNIINRMFACHSKKAE